MEIVGHKQILDFFYKVISDGNLSHAYCFVGPEHIGKRSVAEHLSAKILGVDNDKLAAQPDFFILQQEIHEKTGKTKKDIDIEQIRRLREALTRRSFLGGYKIALIDKAEKMNLNSSNALLKIIEEPKEKTIIFILTKNEESLPDTIRSRCQMVYFYLVRVSEIQDFLENSHADNAEEMARLSLGMPGKAIKWSKDTESYNVYKREILRFLSLFNNLPFYEKLEKINDLFGDKSDHIAAREYMGKVLDLWQILLRDRVYENLGLKTALYDVGALAPLDNINILNIINEISAAKRLLNKNVHPRILAELVLLEIA